MHRSIQPRVLYLGTPVVLISTINERGTANLAPMSSAWWVGSSCMLGLDAESQTTLNLQRAGECVLNLADPAMVDAVDRLALLTGRARVPPHKQVKGYRFEEDKFGAAGLTPVDSERVSPPRVLESLIQLEARVGSVHPFAGSYSGVLAIEVETVRCHVDEDLIIEGSGHYIDPQRWDPLIMKFCEFYAGGRNVRPSRLAKGWGMPALTSTPPGRTRRSRPAMTKSMLPLPISTRPELPDDARRGGYPLGRARASAREPDGGVSSTRR